MQPRAQWWFVITRPSGDTKLAEQPPASRAEERRTLSSHCCVGLEAVLLLHLPAGSCCTSTCPRPREALTPRARDATTSSRFKVVPFRSPNRDRFCAGWREGGQAPRASARQRNALNFVRLHRVPGDAAPVTAIGAARTSVDAHLHSQWLPRASSPPPGEPG